MTVLGQERLRRRRFSVGSWDADGLYTGDQLPADAYFFGSVQPLNDREMLTLPEGERHTDVKKLYTKAAIRTLDERATPQVVPDNVEVDGIWYEVRQWQGQRKLIPHGKYKLVRLDEVVA